MSVVRNNLLTRPGYTPYCGRGGCLFHWPRTAFNGEQFSCACGWRSDFEPEFIAQYKAAQAAMDVRSQAKDTQGREATVSDDQDEHKGETR